MPALLGPRLRGNRAFAWLWSASTVSQVGDQFSFLAMPTIAILGLHAGAFAVGALGTMSVLPALLLSMVSGTIADRTRHPRRLLVISNLVCIASVGSVPIVAFLDHLTLAQLLIAELLTASSAQLANVTFYSVMPAVVGRTGLTDANTRLETTSQVAFLTGPGMAGLLIQAVGATRAVIADAVSFLAAALLLARAPIPARTVDATARPPFLTTLKEGAVFVFGDPRLRRCALASANSNLGNRVSLAVLLLFLYRDVHLTPGEVGVISTVAGIVGPLLAFNAGVVTRRIGLGATLALSALFLGAGLACIPLALRLPAVPVVSVAYLLMSVENGLWNVAMITLRQSFTPDHMFGRMVASTRTVAQGTQPIGTLLGGILGATLGLVPTIVGGGVITMGTGLILARRDLWWAGRATSDPGSVTKAL